MKKILLNNIIGCMMAMISVYSQELYEIERLNLNLWNASEFSPVFYDNGIVFCSNKKNDVVITYTDLKNRSITGMYYAEKKEDFKFYKSEDFVPELNTLHHDGPITFSNDKEYAYFTRNYKTSRFIGNKIDPENKLGIFFAKRNKGVFGDITMMSFCQEGYNYMHPTLSPDNQRIYFASDQPGGYGGFDIYYSEYIKGEWSTPKNMGSKVNSAQDEAFPFIHSSGKLYFASKGHPGLGRFDIYYSEQVDGAWTDPVHLKPPINSAFDDFALIIDQEYESGYFSTARKRRQDDIYGFKSTFPSFGSCPDVKENNYCFVFYEKGSMDIDTTSLKYEWDLGDGTKIRNLEAHYCFKGPGQYLIQLNVIDTLTGEVYYNEASELFNVEDIEQAYFSVSDTLYINEELKLNGEHSYAKNFRIQDFYWNFGDGNRDVGRNTFQTYRKPGEYTIKLGVTNGEEENLQKLCNCRKVLVLKRK